MIIWWALKAWASQIYHEIFHRWAVVEIQLDGNIQIVSTHMSQNLAWGYAYADGHLVIRRSTAVERMARG